MPGSRKLPDKPRSSRADIDRFVSEVRSLPQTTGAQSLPRLMFAMDATLSRQPTWDAALAIQADMFQVAATSGGTEGLQIQLAYFRGHGEFYASDWTTDAVTLGQQMTSVHCHGGHTQIEKVLKHAIASAKTQKAKAIVYIGDCVEENPDRLCHLAGQLGVLSVPVFVFQEGNDPNAELTFREIARLSGGAYSRFSASSVGQLRDLLNAVAAFVVGGLKALAGQTKSRSLASDVLRQLESKQRR